MLLYLQKRKNHRRFFIFDDFSLSYSVSVTSSLRISRFDRGIFIQVSKVICSLAAIEKRVSPFAEARRSVSVTERIAREA